MMLTDKEIMEIAANMDDQGDERFALSEVRAIADAAFLKGVEKGKAEERKRILGMIWPVQFGVGRGSGRVSKANLDSLKESK